MEESKKEEGLMDDKSGEEILLRKRKDKLLGFLKTNYNWVVYILLAIIIWISVSIRTRNLSRLRDVTTNTWTLGPDLDPFLFLRWAEYIVENGKLFAVDFMRNVPLGFDTRGELLLHPYLIAWFHNIASWFGSGSIEQSAVIYPVMMFALTVIAFFFLVRKIFVDKLGEKKANIIALISSFFLTVMPSLLPRTIAGIPEKEASGFFFLFLSFYLFLAAWKSKSLKGQLLLSVLAGVATSMMALVWGGYIYIFVSIASAVFIAFLLGQINLNKFYIYSIWLFSSSILMNIFSTRYPPLSLLASTTTGVAFGVFFIILADMVIFNTKLKKYFSSERFSRIPRQMLSVIAAVILGIIIVSILFGPGFVFDKFKDVKSKLVTPTTDRLGITVAENRQPYFTEWQSSFGPVWKGIPLFFWLFFIGSIYLFGKMTRVFSKRERLILTASFVFFLFAIIFSRYAANSRLNGTNFLSLSFYTLGFLILFGIFGFYYHKYHKSKKEDKLKKIDFGFIFILAFFFFSIVSARGAVRLIMVLGIPASVMVSYFAVASFNDARKLKDEMWRMLAWILVGIVIIATVFSGWQFYKDVSGTAEVYAPSTYTQQWQRAMAWVRENTPQDAVFGHWWDYGYWLQSIGKRATVLDGGNALPYWNHLMGRHALTGTDDMKALEFLYAHDTTHFLIDSSDIGKYSAFSSIGSDENYDRASYIPTFGRDNSQTIESKNSTTYVYGGGASIDEDIVYDDNGSPVFLPGGKTGIGAIVLERVGSEYNQPIGIFVYQERQHLLPLRYAYINGKFIDYGSGVESGIFLMPLANQQGQIEQDGALLYLSKRTVKSQLARLYLYKEENPYFRLVHSEDDFVISSIRAQSPGFIDDFIVFQGGVRGPIRIWEINYPMGIELNEDYLSRSYINPNLSIAR